MDTVDVVVADLSELGRVEVEVHEVFDLLVVGNTLESGTRGGG